MEKILGAALRLAHSVAYEETVMRKLFCRDWRAMRPVRFFIADAYRRGALELEIKVGKQGLDSVQTRVVRRTLARDGPSPGP